MRGRVQSSPRADALDKFGSVIWALRKVLESTVAVGELWVLFPFPASSPEDAGNKSTIGIVAWE